MIMPEPLSILAAVGTAVSLLVNIGTGLIRVKDVYGRFDKADEDIRRASGEVEGAQADLEEWEDLWTDKKTQNAFPIETYKYFWGARRYERVERRTKSIEAGLKDFDDLLKKYFTKPEHQNSRMRKAKFVAFDSPDMLRIIGKLKIDISGLDKITRHAFLKAVYPLAMKKEDIEHFPHELATLQAQSATLWESLDAITTLDTLLVLRPVEAQLATKKCEGLLWKQLRGDFLPAKLQLDFIRNGQGTRLSYRITKDTTVKPRHTIEEEVRNIIRDGMGTGPFVVGSSLQACYERISTRGLAEQQRIRRLTDMERISAAVDIAEWTLLTWKSSWTANVCVCRIHCTFKPDDPGRESPWYSLRPDTSLENHSCFVQDVAVRKHLLVGVLLATLALGCQIVVVIDAEKIRRFDANVNGRVTRMSEDGLTDEILARTNNSYHWAHAIEHCLDQDANSKDKERLEPAHFHLYDEHVLKP